MAPEELIERIKGLNQLVVRLGKREPEALAELDTLHTAAFGIGFRPGCKNCVTKAFHKLQALTLDKLNLMKDQKFKLKKGVVLQYPAFSPNMYNADNITDDVAAKYLKDNPEGKQFFDSLGEIVESDSDEDSKPATAKEVIEKIKVAETVEAVNELAPESDDRVSVRAAALKRIDELTEVESDSDEDSKPE